MTEKELAQVATLLCVITLVAMYHLRVMVHKHYALRRSKRILERQLMDARNHPMPSPPPALGQIEEVLPSEPFELGKINQLIRSMNNMMSLGGPMQLPQLHREIARRIAEQVGKGTLRNYSNAQFEKISEKPLVREMLEGAVMIPRDDIKQRIDEQL